MRVIAAMRDPAERIRDFKEVNLGLTEEQAVAEASRCMYCGACVKGCPVGIDIPGFMKAVSERRFGDGIDIIKEYNVLPAVCGRVCPQENQCEKLCVLAQKGGAVSIGAVERYLADNHDRREAPVIKENGKSAGVVGSGPAGLTAAFELRRAGFDVTVYEALHAAGGVLRYGIPEFRLPDDTVSAEAGFLEKMGVRFRLNFLVGKTLYIDELLETHDGIILSTGAGLPLLVLALQPESPAGRPAGGLPELHADRCLATPLAPGRPGLVGRVATRHDPLRQAKLHLRAFVHRSGPSGLRRAAAGVLRTAPGPGPHDPGRTR